MITIDDIQIFLMTHNRANLIGESILSLLSQTTKVKEITVLDNESTDNTESVVLSFSDRGVNYKKTYGFLGNFNKAKEIVKKKYVMLFHDDDILHPDYLENVLKILNKEKQISAVFSRYTEFWNSNSPKSFLPIETTIKGKGGYFLFKNSKEFAIFMFFKELIAYATAVYKTDFFKQIPIEYEKFSKFNDWPFMVKFGEYGKIALLADQSAFYIRRHSGQDTWTSTNTPTFEQILNWDKFFFDIFFAHKDNFLRKIYSRKATYFYTGKYDAFTSQEQKLSLSKTEFRIMAKKLGLFEKDENLVSKEVYDSWLLFFSEKRHKPLAGKKVAFHYLAKLYIGFLKRYIKYQIGIQKLHYIAIPMKNTEV